MNGDHSQSGEGRTPEELSEEYIGEAVLFVVNWHAASVNMRLYPPTSSMVTDTISNARRHLDTLLEEGERFSVSVLENSLLVNDVRLEEFEQLKAPIKAFVHWMNERGLTNLEFRRGVTPEELNTVFEVLSAASDKDHRQNLADKLVEEGVTNVTINQRVYVAITAGEDISKSSPLDALKDELLMRYLMGRVELGEVEDKELVDVLSDSGKVGGLLSSFISEEGSEGGILVRSQKAEEALFRLSDMINQVEDEGLREMLSDQISGIIAEMSPREMTSMLTGEGPENLNIRRVRERVVTMLSDQQLLEMVDSLIDEYMEMKAESDELETDWQKDKLRNLNELLVEVREDRGEAIAEVIDTKLETAGIEEERDPETGIRVLSAYQLLGGPLEEDFVELADGIDQTVGEQILRLYAMEENELATGMLVKLADNLSQDSPKVRRFAASLVKDTLITLESEYCLMAAGVLEPKLLEDVEAETDYAAYIPQVDSIAVLARCYMMQGNTGKASSIIDLLEDQASPEQEKGPELVKHAASVLEKLTGPEGMIDIQALLTESDEEKRATMVRALAAIGPPALQPLVDMVKDRGQIELRDRALEAIQEAGEPGIQALIAEMTKENPWYVYRNILNVVADLKLTEAVEQVEAMVISPDERIRREALRSLARIGEKGSVPVVQGAASDQSPAVRRTAVRVLGMFGDSSVAPFLIDVINGQGPRGREEEQAVMEAACLALGDLRDTEHVLQLVELMGKGGLFRKARPDEIRAAACVALGTIGDESVAPALEKALKDPSIMVRSSAERSLRKLTGGITTPEPVTAEEAEELGISPPMVAPEAVTEPKVRTEPESEVEAEPAPAGGFRPPPHPESAMGEGAEWIAPAEEASMIEITSEPEAEAPSVEVVEVEPAPPEEVVIEKAPVEEPPVEEPRVAEVHIEETPVAEQPVEQPPIEEPPEEQPAAYVEPSVEQPTQPPQPLEQPAPPPHVPEPGEAIQPTAEVEEAPALKLPAPPEWVEMPAPEGAEPVPPHVPEAPAPYQEPAVPMDAAGPLLAPEAPPPTPYDLGQTEPVEPLTTPHVPETPVPPQQEIPWETAELLSDAAPEAGTVPLEQAQWETEELLPPLQPEVPIGPHEQPMPLDTAEPFPPAPGQHVEIPPEWRRPGETTAPAATAPEAPAAPQEPARFPETAGPVPEEVEVTADWPMPDYPLEAQEAPSTLEPEVPPEEQGLLPADEDYAQGRTDQPATFESLLEASPGPETVPQPYVPLEPEVIEPALEQPGIQQPEQPQAGWPQEDAPQAPVPPPPVPEIQAQPPWPGSQQQQAPPAPPPVEQQHLPPPVQESQGWSEAQRPEGPPPTQQEFQPPPPPPWPEAPQPPGDPQPPPGAPPQAEPPQGTPPTPPPTPSRWK